MRGRYDAFYNYATSLLWRSVSNEPEHGPADALVAAGLSE
jgi:hypothetical protein